MRTICDVCESAAAVVFCAADEAALCPACDQKVHMVNKLASRHVRVGLAEPSEIQRCDICENAPAFFYCEVDGSSLCLQCDMVVHVGGKRTHGRYLLLRQRIEFPGDKSNRTDEHGLQSSNPVEMKRGPHQPSNVLGTQNVQHHAMFSVPENGHDGSGKMENNLIDLNARPQRNYGQDSNKQEKGLEISRNDDSGLVPVASLKQESNK